MVGLFRLVTNIIDTISDKYSNQTIIFLTIIRSKKIDTGRPLTIAQMLG